MPTPPAVPNVIKFRITGTLPTDAAWGVGLYCGYSGGTPSPADMLYFCEGIVGAWNTYIVPFQANTVHTLACDGIDLSSDDGAGNTADVDFPGGSEDAAVANQIAGIVKFDIARRYRGGKPKMYVPGLNLGLVLDDSHWTDTAVNDIGSAFTTMSGIIAEIATAGIALVTVVNVSRYQGFLAVENPVTHRWRNIPAYRPSPLVDAVGGYTMDPLFGTQKRRRLA